VAVFAAAFGDAYSRLVEAERQLSACQFFIPDREGPASFMSVPSYSRAVRGWHPGDGHRAENIKSMKSAEDASFGYRLTSLTRGEAKGWIFHYAPAHRPASTSIESALFFLQLHHRLPFPCQTLDRGSRVCLIVFDIVFDGCRREGSAHKM